jgi:hypothetical protein
MSPRPTPPEPTAEAAPTKPETGLAKLYYMVDKALKTKFEAVATLSGHTPDQHVAELMRAAVAGFGAAANGGQKP